MKKFDNQDYIEESQLKIECQFHKNNFITHGCCEIKCTENILFCSLCLVENLEHLKKHHGNIFQLNQFFHEYYCKIKAAKVNIKKYEDIHLFKQNYLSYNANQRDKQKEKIRDSIKFFKDNLMKCIDDIEQNAFEKLDSLYIQLKQHYDNLSLLVTNHTSTYLKINKYENFQRQMQIQSNIELQRYLFELRKQVSNVLDPYHSQEIRKMNNELEIIKSHKIFNENLPFEINLQMETSNLYKQMELVLKDYVNSIKPSLVDSNHDVEQSTDNHIFKNAHHFENVGKVQDDYDQLEKTMREKQKLHFNNMIDFSVKASYAAKSPINATIPYKQKYFLNEEKPKIKEVQNEMAKHKLAKIQAISIPSNRSRSQSKTQDKFIFDNPQILYLNNPIQIDEAQQDLDVLQLNKIEQSQIVEILDIVNINSSQTNDQIKLHQDKEFKQNQDLPYNLTIQQEQYNSNQSKLIESQKQANDDKFHQNNNLNKSNCNLKISQDILQQDQQKSQKTTEQLLIENQKKSQYDDQQQQQSQVQIATEENGFQQQFKQQKQDILESELNKIQEQDQIQQFFIYSQKLAKLQLTEEQFVNQVQIQHEYEYIDKQYNNSTIMINISDNMVAVGGEDRRIQLLQLNDQFHMKLVQVLKASDPVEQLMMCGEYLVVGTNCGTINLFEINTLKFDGFIKNPSNIIQNSDYDKNSISAILQINESSIILTGNSIGHLILWDLKNFLEIRRIKSIHQERIIQILAYNKNQSIAVGSICGTVSLWYIDKNTNDIKSLWKYQDQLNPIQSMTLLHDDVDIMVVSYNQKCYILCTNKKNHHTERPIDLIDLIFLDLLNNQQFYIGYDQKCIKLINSRDLAIVRQIDHNMLNEHINFQKPYSLKIIWLNKTQKNKLAFLILQQGQQTKRNLSVFSLQLLQK